MGTERFEIYKGPCSCGKGEYIVDECCPDHPWAKPHQTWYDQTITCPECRNVYSLEKIDGKIYLVLNSEKRKREAISEKWHDKIKKIKERFESKGHLEALERKIDSMPSMAAIYRELDPVIHFHHSISTFRNHFKAASNLREWIGWNIHYWSFLSILNWLGRQDSELEKLVDEANRLSNDSKEPLPVIEPAICNADK